MDNIRTPKFYRFFYDCETSGRQAQKSQVLEYAAVIEDNFGQQVETVEIKILLKPGHIAEPEALRINKIDPYSLEWINSAISEKEAAKKLFELSQKYKVNDVRPIFIAYKVDFDKGHAAEMFFRHSLNFYDSFNSSLVDPLKTAQFLIKKEKLKTKIIENAKGKLYNSAKLVDVADALQIKVENAHRALSDAQTLQSVTHKLYEIYTGKPFSSADANPSLYKKNQVIYVVSDSAKSGLKKRYLKIVENSPALGQLKAIDISDYADNGKSPSNLRTFNYATIIDELPVNPVMEEDIHCLFANC